MTSTLKKLFKKTYRYPTSGSLSHAETYVPNTDPISKHARAKTVAVFSAYARTTNGGVYETNKRAETNGALNVQRDGRLAGMPFLFHNPARTVMTVNLQREKPGAPFPRTEFPAVARLRWTTVRAGCDQPHPQPDRQHDPARASNPAAISNCPPARCRRSRTSAAPTR